MDTIEKAVAKLSEGRKAIAGHMSGEQSAIEDKSFSPRAIDQHSKEFLSLNEQLKKNNFLFFDGADALRIEEYRRIKRPLLMNVDSGSKGDKQKDKAANLIMVTSSLPGEGKTFTSINLAVSIAMELDRTVLLVDADVHKPATSTLLGVIDRYGLTDVLADEGLSVPDVLIKTDIPKMTLLSVGRNRENSNELLASSNMSRLVGELANRYSDRVIVIDTPPVLVTNESSILANLVGQVLVVVEAEKTPHSVLEETLSKLDIDGVSVGLILNKGRVASNKIGYYGAIRYADT